MRIRYRWPCVIRPVIWLFTVGFVPVAGTLVLCAQEVQRTTGADWPTYNRDLAGTRYSPLDEINVQTVSELQEIWSYRFHPEDGFIEGPSPAELFQQVTPIVVDGVMYFCLLYTSPSTRD